MTALGETPPSTARLGELDILRGFALLGVFIVHFVGGAFYEFPLDPVQREAWEASVTQQTAIFFSDIFFQNTANTLFATLFGMGFWIMMERLSARGADFNTIYLRRLTILAGIGLVNVLLIFPGDVLFDYAICGFALYTLRWLPARTMLVLGLFLAFAADPLLDVIGGAFETDTSAADIEGKDTGKEEESGWPADTYLPFIWFFGTSYIIDDVLSGKEIGWWLYLLGRLLIGAWIIRQGIITRAASMAPKVLLPALALTIFGLAAETLSLVIFRGFLEWPSWVDTLSHAIGAPTVAVGYALGLIWAFHSPLRHLVDRAFAPVGRTALSCYIGHGAVLVALYYPFGFDLLGIISPMMALFIALGLFALFSIGAGLWLQRYRFGPLEFLWRWGTYGQRPTG